MSSIHVIAAVALLAVLGCSSARAGDFVPRASGNFAAVADDAGARATCAESTANAAMSEGDTATAAHDSPGVTSVHAAPAHSAKHVGVDDAVSDTHAAPAADDDKLAGAHKGHAAARWQSLLPGVMK